MYSIYHADCLVGLKKLKKHSIPTIIVDPPYNIGTPQRITDNRSGRSRLIGQDFGVFDNDAPLPSDWFPLLDRVLEKNGVVVSFYGAKRMHHLLNGAEASGFEIVQDFHWIKTNFPAPMRGVGYAWATESGYIFRRQGEKHKTNKEAGVSPNWFGRPMSFKRRLDNHPTRKRLDVMRWLVKHWSFPGQMVLDPFMGSGTTLVACVQMGRNCIGFENREEYFKVAEKRMKAANRVDSFFE